MATVRPWKRGPKPSCAARLDGWLREAAGITAGDYVFG